MSEALIWGASGGIGQALVRRLKSEGWRVIAAARQAEIIPKEADLALEFEAGNPGSIDRAALTIAQETQGIALIVYAAGGLRAETFAKSTEEDWSTVVDSNLTGAYRTAKAGLNLLVEGGHMIFFGAYGDHLILHKMGPYAVAKAGLEPLVKVLAKENRRYKFTLVRPGAVDTPFWENAPFKLPKDAKAPEAVVDAILEHYQAGNSGELNL
jgi:3-oxoacyl-[acyl-carrier protein] reductase